MWLCGGEALQSCAGGGGVRLCGAGGGAGLEWCGAEEQGGEVLGEGCRGVRCVGRRGSTPLCDVLEPQWLPRGDKIDPLFHGGELLVLELGEGEGGIWDPDVDAVASEEDVVLEEDIAALVEGNGAVEERSGVLNGDAGAQVDDDEHQDGCKVVGEEVQEHGVLEEGTLGCGDFLASTQGWELVWLLHGGGGGGVLELDCELMA